MPSWVSYLTIAAAVGSGLIAGAFFAFSAFIMGAFGSIPAPQGISAMRRINLDVINPWFMAPFIGSVLLGFILSGWSLFNLSAQSAPWLLAASLLYIVGCFGVTMAFNVPRNNALAAASPATREEEALWIDYQRTWTRWNTCRTVASLAAMVCFMVAYRLQA